MIDHPFYCESIHLLKRNIRLTIFLFKSPSRDVLSVPTGYECPLTLLLAPVYGASLFGLLNARNDVRDGTPNNGYSSNEIPLSLARSAHTAAAPIQSLSVGFHRLSSNSCPGLTMIEGGCQAEPYHGQCVQGDRRS